MTLQDGTRLGPYEIVSLRGQGGMGEVYRARDVRLERDVALKVLPASFAADEAARQRFEREAKTISQLNHPNVCTLHDVGAQDGTDYLVLEYLEGETLAERLEKGAVGLAQLKEIGSQIADGIEAAHREGLVHRDLKPGNVMLTRDGAKVLDFGLAKGSTGFATVDTRVATATEPLTERGTFVGTLQYTSPEQVEGKEADRRSDIWALGAVLYEMATGRRAFEADSSAGLVGEILKGGARPVHELTPELPRRLGTVISRCLEKDPEHRWQSARDVALELRALEAREDDVGPVEAAPRRVSPWALAASGLLLLLLGALVGRYIPLSDGNDGGAGATDLTAQWSTTTIDFVEPGDKFTFLPNGDVAIGGGRSLKPWERRAMHALERQPLYPHIAAGQLFYSPSIDEVAWFAEGDLMTMPAAGGAPQPRGARTEFDELAWGEDGYFYFARLQNLQDLRSTSIQSWRQSIAGGEPERVGIGVPTGLLPGERYLLSNNGVLFGEPDEPFDVVATDLVSGESRVLTTGMRPYYVEPGFVCFFRNRSLFAAAIDPETGELLGEPKEIETGVAEYGDFRPDIGWFEVSRSGDLLYVPHLEEPGSRLVWVSRDGETVQPIAPDIKNFGIPSPSPDGRRIAVQVFEGPRVPGRAYEQWILDVETRSWSRPAQAGRTTTAQFVPPEGDEILFGSDRLDGLMQLYVQKSDRSTPPERVFPTDEFQTWRDVSRDGRWVLMASGEGIFGLERRTGRVVPVHDSPRISAAGFHPDGDWIVFALFDLDEQMSNLWIVPFPGPGEPRQITFDGATEPRWSPSGDEIVFRGTTHIMAMSAKRSGREFTLGRPEELFEDRFVKGGVQNWGPLPDGRFLMLEDALPERNPLILVRNWNAKVLAMLDESGGR